MLIEKKSSIAVDARMTRFAPLAFILVSVAVVGVLSLSAWVWLAPLSKPAAARAQESNSNTASNVITNVSFTLYDVGVLPREARVAAGQIAISVIDRSGGSSGIVVERVDGEKPETAGQVQLAEGAQRGRQQLSLQPGTYHVSMKDRPDNSATLIVEP